MKKIWDAIDDFFFFHPVLQKLGTALCVAIVMIAFIFVIALPIYNVDAKKYNDGICKCGGHYEYSQAVGHKTGSTYIYVCDECGVPIEIHFIP